MEDSPYGCAELVDVYDRVAVPLQFAPPANDLVTALHLREGERVLDVGTGTGVAAAAAAAAVGPAGTVIGIDPSLLMLGRAWLRGTVCVVAARAPDLPFRESCFDAVMANFVLSHMKDPAAALATMTQVLRCDGRLGVSSWGARASLASTLWSDIVALFTSADDLKPAFERVIPGDAWFSDAANVQRAMRDAGLAGIEVLHREYPVTISVADYLAMRQSSVEGMLVRRRLSSLEWEMFSRHLAERFRGRFGDSISYRRDVNILVGTKRQHSC
ncbi:MAG: methyltransferase domain-containing protein [Vicinamibacterales bacterium]